MEKNKYIVIKPEFKGYTHTFLDDNGKCKYTGLTLEEMSIKEGVELKLISEEELDILLIEYEKSLETDFVEISEEKYNDMLDCLPPLKFGHIGQGIQRFFMCEFYSGNITGCYVRHWVIDGYKYYSALKNIKISNEEIIKQIINL